MKPVIIGNAELHLCDCMDYMRGLPDKAFELAIVDPPYGIGVNHNMGRRKGNKPSDFKPAVWDNEAPPESFFTELQRVSENQIIWGANHFISRMPWDSPCWLMWDKGFSGDVTFAQYELAWTSFASTAKKYDRNPNQQFRIHPTQKPVKLYEWLLANYAKAGDLILDTHFGSGSSAIACNNLGFKLVGCELDADYFKAACERVADAQRQKRMFA